MNDDEVSVARAIVDRSKLPHLFPTHLHDAAFWEHLGRAVATFGFLEEVLGKAIFALTATREYTAEEIDRAYENWLPTLKRAVSDPLGNLIDTYAKSVRENKNASIVNPDDLVVELRNASTIRNVLCHASWRPPNFAGASMPLFVNRKIEIFSCEIDVPFLQQTQVATAELACAVINTVTHMGWQFPGSNGPGEPIYAKK